MKKVLFSVMLLCACLVCCKSSAPEKQASVQNGEAGQRVTNAAAEQVLDSATPSTKRPGDESLQNVLDAIKKTGLPKYRNFELKESLAVDINNNGDTIYILLLAKEGADGVLLVCKYTEEVLTIIDENDAILDKNEIENGNHSLWDDDKSTFYLRSEYGANGGTGDEGYFTVNSKGVFVDSLILYHRPILFDELSGIDAYIKRASISQKDFGTLRLKDLKADIWDHHKIEFRIQEKDNLPSLKEIFEKISKNSKKDKYYLKSFAGGDKDIERYRSYLEIHPLSDQNHTMYNDIGYYLEQAGAYEEAIYVLSAVLEKYPQRVVAYLNIADAYEGSGEKAKAKDAYEKYANLMKAQGKDVGKIPKRVYDRAGIKP